MPVLKNNLIGALMLPLFFCNSAFTKDYKWSGKGQLYDDRNQYHVICRLTKENTIDGLEPVEITITTPTKLVTQEPGDSKLKVE